MKQISSKFKPKANNMASVLDELLSVLESVPARYTNLTVEYQARLSKHKAELQIYKNDNDQLSSEQRVDRASQVLSLLFGDSAILSDQSSEPMVSEMQQRSWSTNCWLPAKCFVMLGNAVEVALALRVIRLFGARFVIRGTGHNTNPGWSSIDGGILLDIKSLQTIELASDKTTVSVGPGTTWSAVYEKLETHGLTAVGGRAGVVGVGGYTLGGLYLTGEYLSPLTQSQEACHTFQTIGDLGATMLRCLRWFFLIPASLRPVRHSMVISTGH